MVKRSTKVIKIVAPFFPMIISEAHQIHTYNQGCGSGSAFEWEAGSGFTLESKFQSLRLKIEPWTLTMEALRVRGNGLQSSGRTFQSLCWGSGSVLKWKARSGSALKWCRSATLHTTMEKQQQQKWIAHRLFVYQHGSRKSNDQDNVITSPPLSPFFSGIADPAEWFADTAEWFSATPLVVRLTAST